MRPEDRADAQRLFAAGAVQVCLVADASRSRLGWFLWSAEMLSGVLWPESCRRALMRFVVVTPLAEHCIWELTKISAMSHR